MEPTPPQPGPATGSPHGLIVEGREQLLYLLGEAAELEHAVCCTCLYAEFSLRAEPERGSRPRRCPSWRGGSERSTRSPCRR
jgi:hypothetical protein